MDRRRQLAAPDTVAPRAIQKLCLVRISVPALDLMSRGYAKPPETSIR